MIKLYDGQAADLLQNNGKYNPEIRAVSYAIRQEKRRIMDKSNKTRTMAMIDTLPETILDILAVELRTPAYDGASPIDVKRELIKGTLNFYKKQGTPAAVNWIIRTVFGNGGVEEWFDYGGDPHHFRIRTKSGDAFSTLKGIAEFVRLIAVVKRLSSWLDCIIVETDLGSTALRMGGVMARVTTMPLHCAEDNVTYRRTLRSGGRAAVISRTPIPSDPEDAPMTGTMHSGGKGAIHVTLPARELRI